MTTTRTGTNSIFAFLLDTGFRYLVVVLVNSGILVEMGADAGNDCSYCGQDSGYVQFEWLWCPSEDCGSQRCCALRECCHAGGLVKPKRAPCPCIFLIVLGSQVKLNEEVLLVR
jgi:hypothetical protein